MALKQQEYECGACGATWRQLHYDGDPPERCCISCHRPRAIPIFDGVAVPPDPPTGADMMCWSDEWRKQDPTPIKKDQPTTNSPVVSVVVKPRVPAPERPTRPSTPPTPTGEQLKLDGT